jgi:hypothetical protein
MTGFNYSKPEATARRLINRFGKRAYLRRAGPVTGDPYNLTQSTPRDWPITVVELQADVRNAEGKLVTSEGHRLLVSTGGMEFVVPTDHDTVMLGQATFPEEMKEYKITKVSPLQPGDVVILYELALES